MKKWDHIIRNHDIFIAIIQLVRTSNEYGEQEIQLWCIKKYNSDALNKNIYAAHWLVTWKKNQIESAKKANDADQRN